MKTWLRKYITLVFSLALVSTAYSPESNATQDLDPKYFREHLRLVLVEPLIIEDILKLTADGCVWKDELFWNGSPSEESISAKQLWMTFSIQFTTQSGAEFWKSYSFSRKEGSRILEVKDTTKPSNLRDCSE